MHDTSKRIELEFLRFRKLLEERTYLVVALLGLVSIFVAGLFGPLETKQTLKSVFTALGVGLIASGMVAFFLLKTRKDLIFDPNIIRIEVTSDTPLHGGFLEERHNAREVDGLAVLHLALLRELASGQSKMPLRVVTGKKVRLLLLDPRSQYLALRAKDIGATSEELAKRCHDSIKSCYQIWKALSKLTKKDDKSYHGKLEIRLFERPPSIWMYRYDSEILWGLMPSYKPIFDSAVFRLSSDSNNQVFNQFASHFDELWRNGCTSADDGNYLVKYTSLGDLYLNEPLYENLLGPNWKNECESFSDQKGEGIPGT